MNRTEFFIAACKHERWRWRSWRISIFTLTRPPKDYEPIAYDINYREDGVYYFSEEGKWELIEGSRPNVALLSDRELAFFPDGSIPNHKGDLETTYGRVLFNWMVVHYSFGTKIPFTTSLKDVINTYTSNTKDEPQDGNYEDDAFYPSEIRRLTESVYEITSLCEYIAPTGTVKSLTTHPEMQKRRDAMIAEKMKKGPLTQNDIVELQDACIELDKEWLSDGPDADYYIDSKSFSVKRKKMFVMQGMETAFKEPGDFEFIPASLMEGIDLSADKIVAVHNSVREGSYDRGADTALGGAIVNILQRIFQNHKIIEGDCGTKLSYNLLIRDYDANDYIGYNAIVNDELVEITKGFIKENMGKVVAIRRPILCKAGHTDFCAACAGRALARQPRAVASEIVDIGSRIMYAFMQSMHGVSLSVAEYDFNVELT